MSATPTPVTSGLLRDCALPAPGGDKETRGRTLVVGGSEQTPGAVVLAAEAALRTGAGKLQVATVRSVAATMAVAMPETFVLALRQSVGGDIDPACADELVDLARQCSAVLLGPGILDVGTAVELTAGVLPRLDTLVVLDALALAYLTEHPDGVHHLGGKVVLTPNRHELALTLGRDDEHVENDPAGAAVELAQRCRAVVSLGGGTSYVADPSGQVWADDAGGTGLGAAGSGDVMAGILTGLAARGAEPAQAAVWAAHLHGRAGDRLAAQVGPLGFLAREVPPQIPHVLMELAG